jgi:hypothetical protein
MVMLAHEYEAYAIIPEEEDLGQWRVEGWKDQIAALRASADARSCWAADK